MNSKTMTRFVYLVPMLLVVVAASGCISQMAALMYVFKGANVPPEFTGLAKKKVAVVCQSETSSYGRDPLARMISRNMCQRIAASPDKITVTLPAKVEEFIDLNGWDESLAADLGEFADAEMVVEIKISDYSIREGATLYKGRAEYELSVYDVKDGGSLAFAKGPEEYSFPKNGRPSLQTTEREFEAFYLGSLAGHLSRMIVTHDKMENVASEATSF